MTPHVIPLRRDWQHPLPGPERAAAIESWVAFSAMFPEPPRPKASAGVIYAYQQAWRALGFLGADDDDRDAPAMPSLMDEIRDDQEERAHPRAAQLHSR